MCCATCFYVKKMTKIYEKLLTFIPLYCIILKAKNLLHKTWGHGAANTEGTA